MNSFDRAGEALLLRFEGQRQITSYVAGLARRLFESLRRRPRGA